MRILVLNQAEVEHLLPMSECIPLMADTLAALARGEAHQPLRMIVRPGGAAGLMGLMPAYRGGAAPAWGLKAVLVHPGNVARGLDAHQGSVMLFDGETGQLRALMNASAITAIRTAAVSGVATRRLALPDASELTILGAGVQARTHLEAMALVRGLRRVRVASRTLARAEAFAAEMRPRFAVPIEVVADTETAVRGADIVVLATNSKQPVVERAWIAGGAHLNAVGASLPDAREIDSATIAAARLFVDRRESAENEAGDYRIPLSEGRIGPGHICAELGEVLAGLHPGRATRAEITVFKSLGLAVEDLAAADHVYRRAQQAGTGTWVDF